MSVRGRNLTVEQKEVGNTHPTDGTHGAVPLPLPERDVRRKKPPFLSFVLRWETLRRIARVISLLALDFIGVVGALYTAMMVKLAVQDKLSASVGWQDIKHSIPLAYLVTVLCFARLDLYAGRTQRPGLSKIATGLFQATVIALVFALADGHHFSSYFIFYGTLIFATLYITALREIQLRVSGWMLDRAGYERRAVLVGTGKHIEEVARALADRSRTRVDILGYISLTPRPLPMRDFDRLADWHKKRYLVLPGITGLWQVSGRADLDFDDLVRLDFLYLERWSIMLDLSILLKTIPAVLTRRGAF